MCMQEDGDFLSFPARKERDRKSASFPMQHYWTYMNGWVAMAAHRLGRYEQTSYVETLLKHRVRVK